MNHANVFNKAIMRRPYRFAKRSVTLDYFEISIELERTFCRSYSTLSGLHVDSNVGSCEPWKDSRLVYRFSRAFFCSLLKRSFKPRYRLL